MLDAQIVRRSIPDHQVRALANAALLLEDHRIPLPPLLNQVLHEIGAAGVAAAAGIDRAPELAGSDMAIKASKLGRLLKPFQTRD